ncbi:hypothetical protein [Cytobacillus gottheilii]|nr:hypothetical protein [Cytobacillus gottheilii]
MRLKMILALFIILIMGCSNNVADIGTEDLNSEFPPTMTGLIIINGIEHQMEEGGYHWERKKGLETEVVATDHASPYQIADHMKPISVNPNEKVEIMIEENPTITVYLWNENGREKEIEQNANQIIVPSSKGKYIYEALAEWANGTVSYTFVIDIQADAKR